LQFANGQITIFCGEEGSATYRMAEDMKTHCKSTITISPTEKIIENLRGLQPGQVCFSQYDILQQELLNDLKSGTQNSDKVRLLLPLGNEEIHLITLQKSTIRDFKDLKAGTKVAVGRAGSSTHMTIGVIKNLTGGEWEDVEFAFRDGVKALLNNEVEALFFVGAAPATNLEIFSKLAGPKMLLRLIPITDKRLDESYTPATLRAGTYGWVDYPVETYAARSVLVASAPADVKSGDIEKLKILLTEIRGNIQKLQRAGHQNWRRVNYVFDAMNWPTHPAANAVFNPQVGKEKEPTTEEKKLPRKH
jgi:TRAP-type uncharacterized transport system substrate-binding protein